MKRDSVKLGSIHIHPVKAGRAVALESARVEPMGLAGDRRFMLVDAAGDALTQRDLPKLARLEASLDADGLILVFDGPGEEAGERFVPTPEGDERLTVTVWASTVDAALADAATNAALSRWLATPVRLVRIDRPAARTANPAFAGEGASVSFADGYPILVVTAASLRALNRTIVNASDTAEAVPLSRFRPNLVIEGAEPWAEDGWRTIRIGDVVLDLVKPCDRCIVTTIDQATGARTGTQPLDALRQTRLSADRRIPGVLFGWNAVPRQTGTVTVGAEVEILDRRDEPVVRPSRAAAPSAGVDH